MINLKNHAGSSMVSACKGEGAGSGRKTRTKPAPLKQEVGTTATCKQVWIGLTERTLPNSSV